MARKRTSVRKTKQILRLRLGEERSLREVAQSVGNSPSVVHDCVVRFQAAGLSWPLDPELDDGELEARLYAAEQLVRLAAVLGQLAIGENALLRGAPRGACCAASQLRLAFQAALGAPPVVSTAVHSRMDWPVNGDRLR